MIFTIKVQLNFELEREILGFGDSMIVITPQKLKTSIHKKIGKTITLYNQSNHNT